MAGADTFPGLGRSEGPETDGAFSELPWASLVVAVLVGALEEEGEEGSPLVGTTMSMIVWPCLLVQRELGHLKVCKFLKEFRIALELSEREENERLVTGISYTVGNRKVGGGVNISNISLGWICNLRI